MDVCTDLRGVTLLTDCISNRYLTLNIQKQAPQSTQISKDFAGAELTFAKNSIHKRDGHLVDRAPSLACPHHDFHLKHIPLGNCLFNELE